MPGFESGPSPLSAFGSLPSGSRAPMVQPRAPQVRKVTLGLRADKPLAPGVKTQIVVRAQAPFRGERLILADDCMDATVHGIMIGAREQLMGDVPGAMFSSTSAASQIQLDTASVAQDITLTVSRPNGGSFTGALIGAMADDGSGVMPEPAPFVEPLMEEAALAVKEAEEAYEPGVTLEELEALRR